MLIILINILAITPLRVIYVHDKKHIKKGETKVQNTDFLKARFGIEIEMTGVTRNKAAKVVAEVLRGGSIKRGMIIMIITR